MDDHQLLYDLATAEMNIKNKVKNYNFYFFDEVRKAFIDNDVQSYSDLIQVDLKGAVRLWKVAIKEKLI